MISVFICEVLELRLARNPGAFRPVYQLPCEALFLDKPNRHYDCRLASGLLLGSLSVSIAPLVFEHIHRGRLSIACRLLFPVHDRLRDAQPSLRVKRNRTAALLLRRLSNGVDELRDQLRRVKPPKSSQRLYSDYLLTVQGDTDSSANRERRAEILHGLLFSLFERKDGKRTFSPEQRRLLWNGDDKKA
jgi:hypothetical protein